MFCSLRSLRIQCIDCLCDAGFAGFDLIRRSAPKRITRSDTLARLMMETLRFDWPGEEPSSVNYTVSARGKAKKIPALRRTVVYWPWPLKRADFALPVWKQQLLFRLRRGYEERCLECLHLFGFTKTNWLDRQAYFTHLRLSHV